MSCDAACLEFDIPVCTNIVIAGLTPSTLLKACIKKPGQFAEYEVQSMTDDQGVLTIDVDLFPVAYFAFGYFELRLFKKDGDDKFTVVEQIPDDGDAMYDCGMMHVVEITDVTPEP